MLSLNVVSLSFSNVKLSINSARIEGVQYSTRVQERDFMMMMNDDRLLIYYSIAFTVRVLSTVRSKPSSRTKKKP